MTEETKSHLKSGVAVVTFLALYTAVIILGVKVDEKQDKIEQLTETTITEPSVPEEYITPSLSREDSITLMATSLAIIESKCQNVTSSCGQFVGYLQMHSWLVDFCNRQINHQAFTYKDREDWNCCLAMFTIIMDTLNPELDIDRTIDIWNKYCPKAYRRQVKIYYEFLLQTLAIMDEE